MIVSPIQPFEWIAYMDESQQRDHYFVGAALGHTRDWADVSLRLAALRASIARVFGTPLDAEFHGHPLMGGRDDWVALRARHRETVNTYLRALSVVDGTGISYFICGVDVQRLNARYRYPRPPHVVCMDHVLERLNDYARDRGVADILVVADQTSEESSLQERLSVNHVEGTGGYRPSKLERIREPMVFANSADTDGLQVVDLALYLKQREFHVPQERHRKAEAGRRRLLAKVNPRVEEFRVWTP